MARNKGYYDLKRRLRALNGDNCPKCFDRMRWGGNGAGPYATMDYETETLLCSCCKGKVSLLKLVAELREQVKELEEDMECASCGDPNQVRRGHD